ncbi:MAG: serine/threonine-protein kinase [Thermoanaerobaculia bacterium]
MSKDGGETGRFGRYQVQRVLGKGAMGIVYLAEDPVIGRQVAVKVIHAQAGLEGDELALRQQRFEREFRSAGTLSHPNIVTVYDVGQEGSDSFIAMEYVRGESLETVLKSGRLLTFKEIADIALQTASALDYAHERSIIHRDIKPGNILMTVDGSPKITDFGVAKLSTAGMTTTGTIIGTPMYMAPEQITGHEVSPASDQFSLAVVIYEMLTGERPFEGDNATTVMYRIVHEQPVPPRRINSRLPPSLDAVLLRGLAKQPGDRYSTCAELAKAVRRALGAIEPDSDAMVPPEAVSETEQTLMLERVELEGAAPVRPRESRAGKREGRGKTGLFAAAAVLALLAAGGWFGWSRLRGAAAASPEEAAVEETGTVEVDSVPPGAAIFLDDRDTGLITPAFVPVDGEDGQVVTLQLRVEGETVASTQLMLGASLPERWAPALSAAPQRLTVASDPEGAAVTVDGETLESPTPAEVLLHAGVPLEVRLELEGYDPVTRTLTIEDLAPAERESRRVLVTLSKTIPPGFVRVDAPYAVQVEVDGQRRTGSPVSLSPGHHKIRVLAPSVFYSVTREVDVASGETATVSMPAAVSITVAATPGNCQVAIDGRDVGFVPATVDIVPGSHEFHFVWSGLDKTLTETEEIRPDTTRVFRAAPDR